MATIVDIRSATSARSGRVPNAPANRSADILIFTGVRYSRWDAEPAEPAPARRRRDRLDLQD